MADFTAVDLAYAAGIMDGEGTIGVTELSPGYESGNRKRRRKSPSFRDYIAVVMSDPLVPMWLSSTFGGAVYEYPPRKPNHKPTYHWRLSGQKAAEFCGLLLPYLRLKHEQAKLVIAFRGQLNAAPNPRAHGLSEESIEERREVVAKVHRLNQRGVP